MCSIPSTWPKFRDFQHKLFFKFIFSNPQIFKELIIYSLSKLTVLTFDHRSFLMFLSFFVHSLFSWSLYVSFCVKTLTEMLNPNLRQKQLCDALNYKVQPFKKIYKWAVLFYYFYTINARKHLAREVWIFSV